MSCGGGMMRTSQNPLAELVDAVAEKWQAVADATAAEQAPVREEIVRSFKLGDLPELSFHGLRYVLTISKRNAEFDIEVVELTTEIPAN